MTLDFDVIFFLLFLNCGFIGFFFFQFFSLIIIFFKESKFGFKKKLFRRLIANF